MLYHAFANNCNLDCYSIALLSLYHHIQTLNPMSKAIDFLTTCIGVQCALPLAENVCAELRNSVG